MSVGIDVGGTNTDIAIIEDNGIQIFKFPNELSIDSILSKLTSKIDFKREKVIVSTSLPLNEVISKFHEISTLVLLIPGPGIAYNEGVCLKGYVNHRGDLVEDIDESELKKIQFSKYQNVAIAGKFSVRNSILEEKVKEIIKNKLDESKISLSYHCLYLNYPLRINTTILNAKIKNSVVNLKEILKNYVENFFFYKGDGGVIPIDFAIQNPSLLYNSSPAAVAMGAIYLTNVKNGVVIDIGGTTTDFVLIEDGKPALVENMIIAGKKTLVKCVDSFSIPFGGDSIVDNFIKPKRADVPIAFGGKFFTLTDSLNCFGCEIGDYNKSKIACKSKEIAKKAIEDYASVVAEALNHYERHVENIVVTGYLAKYLAPYLEEAIGKKCIIPEYCEAVNAIGVAVSKMSLSLYARFDTAKNRVVFNGIVEEYDGRDDDEELLNIAVNKVRELALKNGASEDEVKDVNVVYYNSYNVVRGGVIKGKIADIIVQIEPGIRPKFIREIS